MGLHLSGGNGADGSVPTPLATEATSGPIRRPAWGSARESPALRGHPWPSGGELWAGGARALGGPSPRQRTEPRLWSEEAGKDETFLELGKRKTKQKSKPASGALRRASFCRSGDLRSQNFRGGPGIRLSGRANSLPPPLGWVRPPPAENRHRWPLKALSESVLGAEDQQGSGKPAQFRAQLRARQASGVRPRNPGPPALLSARAAPGAPAGASAPVKTPTVIQTGATSPAVPCASGMYYPRLMARRWALVEPRCALPGAPTSAAGSGFCQKRPSRDSENSAPSAEWELGWRTQERTPDTRQRLELRDSLCGVARGRGARNSARQTKISFLRRYSPSCRFC